MASIEIHNFEEGLKRQLGIQVIVYSSLVEEEARNVLRAALGQETAPVKHLGTAIHKLFKPLGGVELPLPHREPMREPPQFD